MAKTIRQRIIAAIASAAMTLSGIPPALVPANAKDTAFGSEDALFSSDDSNDQLSGINREDWNMSQLYAKLTFAKVAGDEVQNNPVTVPDNTYYMLIHALISGEDRYQFIPITNDIMEWQSSGFTDEHSAWTCKLDGAELNGKAEKVEGILLKNDDPSNPLTQEQAISRSGCKAVKDIEGRKLNWDGGMNKRRDGSTYTNTFESVSVEGGHIAELRVYEADGWTPSYIQNGKKLNYYTLVSLMEKGTKNVKGWALKQIEPDKEVKPNPWEAANPYSEMLGFSTFYAYGEDGTQTSETIPYDASLYDVRVRVYHTGKGETVKNYSECVTKSDVIPEYCFMSSTFTADGFTSMNVKKETVTYTVNLKFDEPVTILESDNYAVAVEVTHSGGNKTYYFQKVTAENASEIPIVIQTEDAQHWMDGAGHELPHERYSGNEPQVDTRFIQLNPGKEMDKDIFARTAEEGMNGGTVFTNGSNPLGYTLTYLGQTDDSESESHVSGVTRIFNTLNFGKISASKDYDYKSILGPAIDFGITADRFYQTEHDIQSNLEVNYYYNDGDVIRPNLGNTAGQFVISKFVEFPDKKPPETFEETEYTKELPASELEATGSEIKGRIWIKEVTKPKAEVYVDDPARITASSETENINVHVETPENLQAKVNAAIAHMKKVSAELAAKPANVIPTFSGGHITIDTTGFEDGTTLYIDGDAIAKACKDADGISAIGENMTLKIRPNQTIVFNFTDESTEQLSLTQCNDVQVLKADGSVEMQKFEPDTTPDSEKNIMLNKLMRQIVWNMTTVKKVQMAGSAGIFLLPRDNPAIESENHYDDSIAWTTNATSGWMVTAGYYTNCGGEWHFPYQEQKTSDSKEVYINKKAVTGEETLEGASLKLTLMTDGDLSGVTITGQKADSDKKTDKVLTWESSNEDVVLTGIPDGTYTLEETGGTFKVGEKTYSVLDSSTTFELTGGVITASYKTGDLSKAELPIAPAADAAEGGYYRTGNTITVRDAETKEVKKADITVTKKDVTGKETLEGAYLTLRGDDLTGVTVEG